LLIVLKFSDTTPLVSSTSTFGQKIMNKLTSLLASGSRAALSRAPAHKECACNNSGLTFIGNRLNCWAQSWPKAGAEGRELWTRLRSGNVTMGELKSGFLHGFCPVAFWTALGAWFGVGEILMAPLGGPSWVRPLGVSVDLHDDHHEHH
jgi:hypothetical protein